MTDSPPPTDAPKERPRLGYIPAFDGMRGFWVILGPLLYHARPTSVPGGPDIVPGGILSLDLFFVLSSYLIVTIALKEWGGTGGLDMVAYAGRRVRRLFPALFLVCAFLTLYLILIDDASLVDRWTGAIVSSLLYVNNWYEIASGVSYFEEFQTPSPLKHVWSFSIEEQFYLFAPFFLIAGLKWGRRWGKQILLVLSVVGAIASAVWMAHVHVVGEDPSRAYYGTDTRAQALFVGIAMALAINLYGPPRSNRGRTFVALLAYPATALHLWAVLQVSERDSWLFEQGGFLLIAVAAGVALWGMSQPAPWSPLHRFFEAGPTRYAGRISYGLYLYHWPIYLRVTPERAGAMFGTDEITGWPLLIFHLTLTVAISVTSFHLLEQPFVRREWPFRSIRLRPYPAAFAGVSVVAAIFGGLLLVNANKPPEVEQVLIVAPGAEDAAPGADGSAPGEEAPESDDIGFGNNEVFGVPDADGSEEAADEGPLRILVVGDSVSAQIGWSIHEWGVEHPGEVVVFNESHLGCPIGRWGEKRVAEGDSGPVGAVCSEWAVPVAPHEVADSEVVSWVTAVEFFEPDIVLAHVSAWDVVDRIVPGVSDEWTSVGDPAYDDFLLAEYTEANEVLSAGGANVQWLSLHYLNRPVLPDDHMARVDGMNEIALAAIEAVPDGDIDWIDYSEFIGPVGGERDVELRDDGVHLDQPGFEQIGPWLLEQMGLIEA